MGLPNGLPWSNRRISRTLSLSLLVLCAAFLAGPGAAATVPHPGSITTPVAVPMVAAHASSPINGPTGLAHTPGEATPSLRAILHSDPHPSWLPARPAGQSPVSSTVTALKLAAAARTLAVGAGPAHGTDLTCTQTTGSSSQCRSATPSVATETWQNASGDDNFFGLPPQGEEGAMAYDAYDGYVVYFGGCDIVACPDNQTWGFDYGYWFLISGSSLPAPPAEELAAMDYDQVFQVVLLYGGCSLAVCPDNYTWYYTGSLGWTNITNALAVPSIDLYGAQMTFAADPLDNYTVMFGGCEPYCLTVSNVTYAFTGFEWFPIPTTTTPTAVAAQGFVYDPVLGGSVMFGGCNAFTCGYNTTWEWYNVTWYNITSALTAFSISTPTARGYMAMSWDELDNELVMYGGWTGSAVLGDTWTLTCPFFCQWNNVTAPGTIPALDAPAMPGVSNATVGGTFLFGGEYQSGIGYYPSNGTFFYEPTFSIAPVVPGTAPARSTVNVAANPSGGASVYFPGTGGATWWYGLNYSYGANSTLNFTWPGSYTVNLLAYDYFGVYATDQFTVVATGPSTSIVGGTATDVGANLALSAAAATGGNAPYNYTWTFGDGTHGYGLSVTHAWSTAGTFAVGVEVRDAENLTFNATQSVTIGAAPSVTVAASHTTIDAGMSITFTPTVTGGTTPFTYAWTFSDGTTGSTATAPAHTFAAAGSYKVVVNVTDGVAIVASSSVTVTVNPAVGGTASASATSVVAGTSDTFSVTGSGGTPSYTYAWVFGDAKTGTGASVSHTYATAGTYTAKVWINDSVGGSYSTTVVVTVTASNSGGGGGSGTSGSSGGLSGTTLYIVIAVIAILVVAGLAFVMMRKKSPPPSSGAPPSGAAGTATPPPGASSPWSETPPPPGAGGSS